MLKLVKPDANTFDRWFEESAQRQAEDRAWAAGGSVEEHRAEVDQMIPILLPEGIETPGHVFRVAEDESGADVAFVWVGVAPGLPPGTKFLFDIVVRSEHRRQGATREILTQLLTNLSADGTETVMLQARGDNAPALALYERLGFARTETSEDGKQVQMMLQIPAA